MSVVNLCVLYLSIGSLSQHFKQLELRRVCFFTALLNMVADVDLLQYAVVLKGRRQTLQFQIVCHIPIQPAKQSWLFMTLLFLNRYELRSLAVMHSISCPFSAYSVCSVKGMIHCQPEARLRLVSVTVEFCEVDSVI